MSEEVVNVICMKWGTKFDAHDVNVLYSMIQRHLTLPYRFVCLTDEFHNRMRIISPIAKIEDITAEQIRKCMEANFHTALDIKYAFSDGIVWAAFIHPLKELSDSQFLAALKQVVALNNNFGSSFTSTDIVFGA